MRIRRPLIATLLAGSLALSACSGGGSSEGADEDRSTTTEAPATGSDAASTTAPAAPPEVEIVEFSFDPVEVEVGLGETLTFANDDEATHTATSREGAPAAFDTGQINDGDSATVTFSEPGEYEYYCSIHDYMTGTVRVVA